MDPITAPNPPLRDARPDPIALNEFRINPPIFVNALILTSAAVFNPLNTLIPTNPNNPVRAAVIPLNVEVSFCSSLATGCATATETFCCNSCD